MAGKPQITIIGAGNVASALAISLQRAGYEIDEIVSRGNAASMRRARQLAEQVDASAVPLERAQLKAPVVWFCVPDSEIVQVARSVASGDWKGRIAFHSSGALTSDELSILRRRGAAVASLHPLMTFVRESRPVLAGVPFAVEGDAIALGSARRILKDLHAPVFPIRKGEKTAYHAWGTFASPLLIALLATTERVAAAAGVPARRARKRMLPILAQTVANYAALGPAEAFSGPIVRGDVATVRKHLRALRRIPKARDVYMALARGALDDLPIKNRAALKKILNG